MTTRNAPLRLRVIAPECRDAVDNMAFDQALVEATDDPTTAVLRFYTWREPTLSLGYFQSSASRHEHAASESLAMVRRASGGGAIVHDRELTYSLTVSRGYADRGGSSERLYRSVHQRWIAALGEFGVRATTFAQSGTAGRPESEFLCFRRRTADDLIVSGYKVVGSAQRRGRTRLIQHGSVLLSASDHAPELPGLNDLTSRSMDPLELADAVTERIAELDGFEGIPIETSQISRDEQIAAAAIAATKFGSPAWIGRR